MHGLAVTPNEAARHGLALNQDGQRRTAFQLLAHPDMDVTRLSRIWPELAEVPRGLAERVENEARYDVYLARQARDVDALRRDEAHRLPDTLDYAALGGLSAELSGKLAANRPATLGHASRIEGITPAALTLLAAHAGQARRRSGSVDAG